MMRYGPALLLALSVAAFGGDAQADEEEDERPARHITVRMLDYRFEPATITLSAGETVELTLINDGAVLHEFVTEALETVETDLTINGVIAETTGVAELEVPPKGRATLRFTPETPGAYPFTCDAKKPQDHLKAGMAGTLIIK